MVRTSADDFLDSTTSINLLAWFITHIQQFISITMQEGPSLKYLNVQIIQTELDISYGQMHHI